MSQLSVRFFFIAGKHHLTSPFRFYLFPDLENESLSNANEQNVTQQKNPPWPGGFASPWFSEKMQNLNPTVFRPAYSVRKDVSAEEKSLQWAFFVNQYLLDVHNTGSLA